MTRIPTPRTPGYNFMTDMTDQAINWMKFQKSLTPDKPFFMYFAPGATHAPHHPTQEWIEKNKGRFDAGWDKMREQTLARQIELGVVPKGTKLAPKPEGIKDWDKLSADEKKLFARQMEVFSAYGEYADHEIGRLFDSLREIGQFDNTLIFYLLGDNGSSPEGGANGMSNEMTFFNGVIETVPQMLERYEDWGGPRTYPHFASGWAIAGNAPFMCGKQTAGNYGGTRNGMVVSWPKGIKANNEIRSQWHHVIDVAPTILAAAGLPEPESVHGVVQEPIQGVSMLYALNDSQAAGRRMTQYFEIAGGRGIYHDGWFAGVVHSVPWESKPRHSFQDDQWELYDTTKDFSLTNDLAASNPAKLKEMQDLFMSEAIKNRVLPLDDRRYERQNAALAGRPELLGDRTSITLWPGITGMSENSFVNMKNRSFSITADLDIPEGGAEGVLLAQGGHIGGWSFYLKDSKPVFTYNFVSLEETRVAASDALKPGKNTVRVNFDYDGGGIGQGGTLSILVNGKMAAKSRIERTQPFVFSADETAGVGIDEATTVTTDYPQHDNAFTGKSHKVVLDVKPIGEATKLEEDKSLEEAKPK
jgi:arylsulfatase